MDPRLLKYYNRELQFIREMGVEFAQAFPKIAGRLALDEFECADPYVERLLEGFSFLSARIQLKIDEQFPRFTQHLLERVYPHYLSPTPSIMIVQFQPDLTDPSLADGSELPRNTVLRSRIGKGDQTPCEYRTAHQVTLWPIELTHVEYLATPAAIAAAGVKPGSDAKASLRLRFRTTADIPFNKLELDSVPFYLRGGDEIAMRLYESLIGHATTVISRSPGESTQWNWDSAEPVGQVGFGDDKALLPFGPRSFQGYRLLEEYFAHPQRFMFVELNQINPAVRRCAGNELEIFVILNECDPVLESTISINNFLLFCTPAVNLFPKRCDRIHLTDSQPDYHIVPDRTRPMDFEVYEVTEVTGFGTNAEQKQRFLPFYAYNDFTTIDHPKAYYALNRLPRLLSSKQQRTGTRSTYVGSELFVSLVDADEAPYQSNLRQISVSTLCTNRDLPLHIALGQGITDFTMEASAPVNSIRCIGIPSKPKASFSHGAVSWRLINHLSLNYLSIADEDPQRGTAVLKEFLQLYADLSDAALRKQVDGVISVTSRPVNRRIPTPGPITFGRGLEITLMLDESAFQGSGAFLFGAVMEQFFRRYTAINSFTETVITTLERGEIMRWPVRTGRRQIL